MFWREIPWKESVPVLTEGSTIIPNTTGREMARLDRGGFQIISLDPSILQPCKASLREVLLCSFSQISSLQPRIGLPNTHLKCPLPASYTWRGKKNNPNYYVPRLKN